MRVAHAFVAALGIAIVITALTLRDRQTPAVINSLATGAARMTEAALGQMPSSGTRRLGPRF